MRYILSEEGFDFDVIEAASLKEAIKKAKKSIDDSGYTFDSTIWCDYWVRNENDPDDCSKFTLSFDPKPPKCTEKEHDWQSPYEILGGLKENSGVWGNGGGVNIIEVCMNCGCGKHTNTWAQRYDTGEQGLVSVRYEEDEFLDDLDLNVSETDRFDYDVCF